jgi:hypothetical protein
LPRSIPRITILFASIPSLSSDATGRLSHAERAAITADNAALGIASGARSSRSRSSP